MLLYTFIHCGRPGGDLLYFFLRVLRVTIISMGWAEVVSMTSSSTTWSEESSLDSLLTLAAITLASKEAMTIQ